MRNTWRGVLMATTLAFVSVACAAAIQASSGPPHRRGPVKRGAVVFVGGYFYDPFFGPYPWWVPAQYPHYYPVFEARAEVRVLVTPKDAAVYVDGYYAGIVDDFDGLFQRLPVTPGPHEIDLYLPGYRTVHHQMYVGPHTTYSLRASLVRLLPGEVSDPPYVAPALPAPPAGTARLPRTAPPLAAPPPTAVAVATGALAIRVQPLDAEVSIDGEYWTTSGATDRLVVQLGEGAHRIEVVRSGYLTYAADVIVRAGETATLNVSLAADRR